MAPLPSRPIKSFSGDKKGRSCKSPTRNVFGKKYEKKAAALTVPWEVLQKLSLGFHQHLFSSPSMQFVFDFTLALTSRACRAAFNAVNGLTPFLKCAASSCSSTRFYSCRLSNQMQFLCKGDRICQSFRAERGRSNCLLAHPVKNPYY